MMTIQTLLRFGHEILLLSSNTARLDAEILLSYVLKRPVTFLLAHDDELVGFWDRWRYQRLIAQRKKGKPVAYITGTKSFYCLDFKVNRHTLIPRPDTEILVEEAIDFINAKYQIHKSQTISNNRISNIKKMPLLIDVGTGSGCIPIAILKHVPHLKALATDVSSSALRVAQFNAKTHGVSSRLSFLRSDLLADFDRRSVRNRALIVTANLPYIPPGFPMTPETGFEPELALYSNDEGLELYKKLVQQLLPLRPYAVFFECFDFQAAILSTKMPGYRMEMKDMSGKARVVAFYLI